MRGAGVGGLVAQRLQPLVVGLVHALGDGSEEVGAGSALAPGRGARQFDGAAQGRAGGEAARNVDGDAVVLEGEGIDDLRLVAREIVIGDCRAASLQIGGDIARQAAFVVFTRTALGQAPHRLAEIAELDVAAGAGPVAGGDAAVVAEIAGLRGGELLEVLGAIGDHHLHVPVELHAALGQLDTGLQYVLPLQRAEAVQRLGKARDHAGHGDRVVADLVALFLDVGPGERVGGSGADDLVDRGVQLLRRDRTVVDGPGAAFLGAPDGHEADTADTAHPWFESADGHACRDRRIDGIAALAQDFGADFGGLHVLRDDDTLAADRLLGEFQLPCQRLAHLCSSIGGETVAGPHLATKPVRLQGGLAERSQAWLN